MEELSKRMRILFSASEMLTMKRAFWSKTFQRAEKGANGPPVGHGTKSPLLLSAPGSIVRLNRRTVGIGSEHCTRFKTATLHTQIWPWDAKHTCETNKNAFNLLKQTLVYNRSIHPHVYDSSMSMYAHNMPMLVSTMHPWHLWKTDSLPLYAAIWIQLEWFKDRWLVWVSWACGTPTPNRVKVSWQVEFRKSRSSDFQGLQPRSCNFCKLPGSVYTKPGAQKSALQGYARTMLISEDLAGI